MSICITAHFSFGSSSSSVVLFPSHQSGGHFVVGVDQDVTREQHVESPEPDILASVHLHGLSQAQPAPRTRHIHSRWRQQEAHGDVDD